MLAAVGHREPIPSARGPVLHLAIKATHAAIGCALLSELELGRVSETEPVQNGEDHQ